MIDFNETKDSYRESIDDAISFIGADHEFFIAAKGEMINRFVEEHFGSSAPVALLDVGCGHGYVHPPLVAAGHRVTGVEIAADVLDVARQANPTVDYRPYDGETLPFPDASFDGAIAMCVVHHVPVPQWDMFAREMRRVVRPGGFIAVFEHNPLNPLTRYVVATCPIDEGVTLVRRRRLEGMLRSAGCKSVRSSYIFFTPFGRRFFRWLDRKLAWLPLGAQYFTFAER